MAEPIQPLYNFNNNSGSQNNISSYQEMIENDIRGLPIQQKENILSIQPDYIINENTIVRADGQQIEDDEVTTLIQMGYENTLETNKLHKTGKRNIFTDTQFSEKEQLFFKCVYDSFQNAGLNPNLIKFQRLSSGMFNVEYLTEGYLGKVQISETKDTFRVIKQGAKRASKTFNTLNEAEQYINEKTNYYIDHKESKHTYFMQYFIGQKLHDDYFSEFQELINTIPRWVKYTKYMKRN